MWRALFLAVGGVLLVLAVESLVLDHAVLATDNGFIKPAQATTEPVLDEWGFEIDKRVVAAVPKKVSPPEWAPWSMLSSGVVLLFYGIVNRSRKAVTILDDDDD